MTPAALTLGPYLCSSFPFQGKDLRVAGVGVAPPQVGVELAGEHDVVRMVRVVEHEAAQRSEVRLDRIRPRRVRRRETQLDVVLGAPGPDLLRLVRREVVQDDVDGLAVGPGVPARLDGGEAVLDALAV